ncbi:hypothetical protein EI71_01015 [Anaeroplasma bactoclasticum]|jgi:hypothetical protein|uniref:Peptidase S24-like protein n=1 Tax=Anaeroplasma bactoclasticum TaxID=2088 RepID=A0A397RU75_9MOLU|nr:hypothetical protein [Anaeroplasma bactoclasticum]RIA75979.1 hypothetical protein EI71_01015 [Anaeroplasma bactoclasticum]
MKKFQQASETEDLLDELLEGIDLNQQAEEEETETEAKAEEVKEKGKSDEERGKYSKEQLEVILERVDAGLIGSLPIGMDPTNRPILKKGDIAQLRKPNRLLRKDFVFYKIGDDYFLRRIIKFKGDDIYVAGDGEHEYHIIHKEDVVAKVVGRERGKKYISFGFFPKGRFYTWRKVNLAYLRLGNRIKTYESDQNAESLEAAMQLLETQNQQQQTVQVQTPVISSDIDLDSDLAAFIDPDELVMELREEQKKAEEEEVIYVDEYGNEIKDYDPNAEANKGQFVQGASDEDEDEEFEAISIEDQEKPMDDENDGTLVGPEDIPEDDILASTDSEDENM